MHEAAKAILGDILGVNYAVDPLVQGTVTVETAQPVARKDVLPIFEEALRASKLALVKQGEVYTVVALDKAVRQPQLLPSTSAGYGNEAIPLHFVNAVELKKLLDPLLPEKAIAQADASRNMLLITGTAGERRSIRELVRQFDVDWMQGMSFALLVPTRTDMHVLLPELDAMVNAKDSPTAGLVRLIPIERLNGILAISAQPRYLSQLKKWVGILDRAGGENERKLFVYHVQNGRASDLATVLVGAFGGTPAQQTNSTTPNLTATGQATSVQGFRPGFGFQGSGASGSPGTGTAFQPGMGSQQTGFQSGSSFGTSSTYQSNSATGSTSQSGENSGPGTNQPAPIVSQTLMLPGQVTPISITSDDGNNSLVFYSTPRQYGLIEDALRQLDVLPLQVLIEAAITEVTLNDTLQYGVQWRLGGGAGTAALSQGTTNGLVQVFPGFSYFVANGNGNIAAALNELSDVTTVKVLSAPKVLVLNNHTAALQVGDEVPILQAQVTSTLTSDASVTNEVDYRDTGVILNVTPRVNDSGLVLLDISQEVSDVSNTTTSAINSPTIAERKIASSIAVKDGQTVALGGLIRDNRSQEKTGIPYLNDIPFLGFIFGGTNNQEKRTELLVLLTPRVVRNAEDVKTITEELREKIHAATPLSPSRLAQ
ncbi:MAG: type II secretion system secretin GspD [Alphaproteobacteria bacterium]|nr:type II secretion system secretin GspD [Alphaproteobacteria bacterium]MBV9062635.1 type II secretion system secretin GspD [Alphaproteobacteria bacterium]